MLAYNKICRENSDYLELFKYEEFTTLPATPNIFKNKLCQFYHEGLVRFYAIIFFACNFIFIDYRLMKNFNNTGYVKSLTF